MVRCSLTKAEELLKGRQIYFQMPSAPTWLMVNHIEKIEGSRQGYRLFFDKVDSPVPVSKKLC
ncbi:MAG: hypothetical protein MZV63_09615 [Marinilabiliales bacterium]|nr:hypothetical protein [Marinilabiliales bacterium]